MSRTLRRNRRFFDRFRSFLHYIDRSEPKYVRDGEYNTQVRSNKNRKRSTRKLQKLKILDVWNIPNHDKFGRTAP